jgi:hypothetical protein
MARRAASDWTYQPAGGGWLLASNEQADRVAVRFAKNEAGRWEPIELRMDADRPLDSTMLRRVPLASMESAANGLVREYLEDRLHLEEPPQHWRPAGLQPGQAWMPKAPRIRAKVDPGAKKTDAFYERVAALYSARAARSSRPAVEMANANGVPVTTVHRWVKEARRRGFLPPGQKGRRG